MDPRIRTALWALVGVALAVGISMSAFAVAGSSIGEPSGPVRVVPTLHEGRTSPSLKPHRTHEPSEKPEPSETPGASSATFTSTSSTQPSPSNDPGGDDSGPGGATHDGNDD